MDLNIIHLAMELSAAACLFFIAWLNIYYNASGKYSNIVAVGTAIAGIADLIHAFSTSFLPELLPHWIPFSWGMTRITLLMMFLMIILCYDRVNCTVSRIGFILLIPLAISVAMVKSDLNIGWVYASFDLFGLTVHRPLDFMLLIGWVIIAYTLQSKSRYLFPPNTYWLFMAQGILVHAVMTFGSKESLDICFMFAHAIKISEYYTFILIYLMYKNQLDNVPRINTPIRISKRTKI